jgi:xanthine/CO dehydrogenase XdhC/CoxF family maturation factor
MHGVAAAVGAWLDAGEDPVVVRVPLAEGIGGAGPGEVLAFGRVGHRVGGLLGGAVDDVAAQLVDEVRATGQRQVESVQITNRDAAGHGLTCGGLVTVVADPTAALPVDWRAGRAPMVFAGPLGAGGPITSVAGRRCRLRRRPGFAPHPGKAHGPADRRRRGREGPRCRAGPAGLDLGGTTANEVALAICAEVLAVRNGRPPLSLQATSGPIHQ